MKRALFVVIAAAAAIFAIAVTWRQNEKAAGLDFYIYYVNAQLAGRGDVANIYAPEVQERIGEEYYARAVQSGSELRKYDATRRRRLDNVSSPFLYTTFAWVSRDYDKALRQYHALVLFAFIAGFLLIARRAKVSWTATLFLLAAVLLWYRGFEADLRVGNVNSLQLLMIGIALSCWPLFAGIALGLLVAFKPNLILVVLLLVISRAMSRDWRRLRSELWGGVIGVVTAIVATAIYYGTFDVWVQWVTAANQFFHRLQTRAERNVAPALEIYQQQGTQWSYAIAGILIAIACIAMFRRRKIDDVLVVGIGIVIYLVSSPVVWLHYMVLVLPLALGLMRWKWTAMVAGVALIAIAEEPFELLSRIPVYPNDALYITPALIALYVCGVWALRQAPSLLPARSVAPHPARAAA